MSSCFITMHAIDRYRLRVDPNATVSDAARAIRQIAEAATCRSTPRRWTGVSAQPGSRYLFNAQFPGVCLVERGGAIRTVFGREASRAWRAARAGQTIRQRAQRTGRPRTARAA